METVLDKPIVFAIAVATLSLACFCAASLFLQSRKTQVYLPLGLFFLTLCSATGGPVIDVFAPASLKTFYRFTFPAYIVMGPLLWLYVKGLTAETKWHVRKLDSLHFIPFILALLLVVLDVIILESQILKTKDSLYWESQSNGLKIYVGFMTFLWAIAKSLWYLLPFYYLIRILKHLSKYRKNLKALFASIENRTLGWVSGYMTLFAAIWIIVLITTIKENVFGATFMTETVAGILFLTLTASLGLFGLSQKPGFEGQYLEETFNVPDAKLDKIEEGKKYKRSALTDEHATRIAKKIEKAMKEDKLYLDPMLSLHKLAKHIRVSPNYISQTLNTTMGDSFFDYVNKWRIKATKADISKGEKTILAIAYEVGFNSRSSFYKAFKREMGLTPSEFRQHSQKNK